MTIRIAAAAAVSDDEALQIERLLSRAYTGPRHLDAYSEDERARWAAPIAELAGDALATMPQEWLDRFPTVRNLRCPAGKRTHSVHFLDADEGAMRGHVSFWDMTVYLGDRPPLAIGYIEDVATLPAAGGSGIASALMERAARHGWDRGLAMLGLSTGIPAFYERLGWRVWVGRSAYMLRGGGEEQNDRTMLLPLTSAAAELLNAGSGQRLLGTPRGP